MDKKLSLTEIFSEEVLILAKAYPLPGAKHGETVCCAGVTREGQWRRQYPIPFRRLKEKFDRWEWIEYKYKLPDPSQDKRTESRRVQENTIFPKGKIKESEKSRFLEKVIVPSTRHASELGMSLALVRPRNIKLKIIKKKPEELKEESDHYKEVGRQRGLFDSRDGQELKSITPCPYKFIFSWTDAEGKSHQNISEDWEIPAMFHNLCPKYGEKEVLKTIRLRFEEEYPKRGVVFAMGTHSRWSDTWLLIGIIRLNETEQDSLF
ncbi:hypothetical protein HKD28_12225 [Gluconobacter sp. LMG 1744]|uniref:hypothetical protein n=1 Tax=Gluconobacter cadivus TaxID=2728101 RepID=UPI00188581E0|nr:hypothetical protein [Gluconobacter cadivus]MBF0892167.1 hypothetical protein [Gluconobacter cadivus]